MMISSMDSKEIFPGMKVFYKALNLFGAVICTERDYYEQKITIRWENGHEETHDKSWFCGTSVVDDNLFFISMGKIK